MVLLVGVTKPRRQTAPGSSKELPAMARNQCCTVASLEDRKIIALLDKDKDNDNDTSVTQLPLEKTEKLLLYVYSRVKLWVKQPKDTQTLVLKKVLQNVERLQ